MEPQYFIQRLSRRDFLKTVTALPAVTCLAGERLLAEESRHEPQYLGLQKFIEPGNDEFLQEKAAMELRERLHQALAKGVLPVVIQGKVRRAEFYALPGEIVRYEIASERDGKLFYQTGRWKVGSGGSNGLSITALEEHTSSAPEPYFRDVTAAVFERVPSFHEQLSRG
ncbi:MAG: twin-arginine translocation signal domain-containing protein, partial [Acidobacteriaceae bacterium]|nr:twin-arginine translocation signal domain-containing protein [Acidobacteriaceae bacterium]